MIVVMLKKKTMLNVRKRCYNLINILHTVAMSKVEGALFSQGTYISQPVAQQRQEATNVSV